MDKEDDVDYFKEFKEKITSFLNKKEDKEATTTRNDTKPSFCKGYDCPAFTCLCDAHEGIELRKYEPSSWATCQIVGKDCKKCVNQAFFKLFKYIFHGNDKSVSIPMTVPVLIKEVSWDEATNEFTFQMCFYMTSPDVPSPNNKDVSIINMSERTFFVYSFPGMIKAPDYASKYETAKNILQQKLGFRDVSKDYYFVGYNSPFELFNRHNEIWIEATPDQIDEFCRIK